LFVIGHLSKAISYKLQALSFSVHD